MIGGVGQFSLPAQIFENFARHFPYLVSEGEQADELGLCHEDITLE